MKQHLFKLALIPFFSLSLQAYPTSVVEMMQKDGVNKVVGWTDYEKEIDEEFKNFLIDIGKANDVENIKKIEVFFTHYQKYKMEFQSESMGTQRFYQLVTMLYLALNLHSRIHITRKLRKLDDKAILVSL